jgi:hypothetical protein
MMVEQGGDPIAVILTGSNGQICIGGPVGFHISADSQDDARAVVLAAAAILVALAKISTRPNLPTSALSPAPGTGNLPDGARP